MAIFACVMFVVSVPRIVRAVGEVVRARSRVRKRMAMGAPTLDDRALATVTGTVQLLDKPLIAPLSGTPCVAHSSRARRYAERDAPFGVKQIIDERVRVELTPFLLSTASGEVVVDGASAELAIRPRPVIPRRMERERTFLRDMGMSEDLQRASFEEIVIADGMKITVFGVSLVEVTPGESHYRETTSRVRLTGDDKHPLTIREP